MKHQPSLGRHFRLHRNRLSCRWDLLLCDGVSVCETKELSGMKQVMQFISKPQYVGYPILGFDGKPSSIIANYNHVRDTETMIDELCKAVEVYVPPISSALSAIIVHE